MEQTFPILVIDDDPNLADILHYAAQKSFPEARFIPQLSIEDATSYLHDSSLEKPKLILLDINFNREEDGLSYLVSLQKQLQPVSIPILILSYLASEENIQTAYSTGAVSFLEKPQSFDEWGRMIDSLRKYWKDTVDLPQDHPDSDTSASLYRALNN